jgi:hypothetical protein
MAPSFGTIISRGHVRLRDDVRQDATGRDAIQPRHAPHPGEDRLSLAAGQRRSDYLAARLAGE